MSRRDTRTAIIDAAVTLLGRDGPDAFSAAVLAREVGVSKATLFHHFASIDEIPLAAFDRLMTQMLAWPFSPDDSLEQKLARLGAMTFEAVASHRGFLNAYFVFFGKAMFDERLRARFHESIAVLLARMREIFAEDIADPAEAAALARMVAIFLDGLALHLLALDHTGEIERAWRLFRRMTANAAANEGSGS